jgi:2-polyprenyl-6-methoxyphenol hydroxylase-like FAD-dependent oxidoreductase
MNRQHRVLVVGAGPCGLMTACELRRRGIDAAVIDAAPQPHRGSRAILLWPPTLRLYRDLGILPEAERRGVSIRALAYHLGPGRTLRLPLAPAMAPLVLPQQDTDELLDGELRRLGDGVEWGLTLTSLEPAGDHVTLELRRADGTTELRRADWLIGADGVRSTVREQLHIPFEGAPLPITFLLAEGRVTGDYDREAVNYFIGRAGGVLIAPLPGGKVRISAPLPDGAPLAPDTAQRMLDERGPGGLHIEELTLNTTFSSQERIAARMRAGRCFLVGDAAHTHSVVGGQGLNLGFGDARNLAWKLAGVLDRRLDPKLLDTYDPERRAAAQQIVRSTARMARQAKLGPVAVWLRNAFLSAAHRSGALGRRLPPMLAGWAIRYPHPLIEPIARGRSPSLPPAGTHSPDWTVERGERDLFELVTLGPEDAPQRAQSARLAREPGALLSHRHVVAAHEGFLLLRPDGFVAASGRRADLDRLTSSLAKLAGPNQELPR